MSLKINTGYYKNKNEYIFYHMIEEVNKNLPVDLTVTQCQRLRQEFETHLKNNGGSMLTNPEQQPAAFGAAFTTTLANTPGFADFDTKQLNTVWYSANVNYDALTGNINNISPEYQHHVTDTTRTLAAGATYLPISPYNPDWANNTTVRENGTRLLAIDNTDLTGVDINNDPAAVEPVPYYNKGMTEFIFAHSLNTLTTNLGVNLTPVDASRIRQEFIHTLDTQGFDPYTTNPAGEGGTGHPAVKQALHTAFKTIGGYQNAINNGNTLGLDTTIPDATGWYTQYATNQANPQFIASPYDPTWFGNIHVQQNYPNPLPIPATDVTTHRGPHQLPATITLNTLATNDYGETYARPAGPATSTIDKIGLSGLTRYMSEEDFNKIKPHLIEGFTTYIPNADGNLTPTLDQTKAPTPQSVQKTFAILDHLRTSGTAFTIREGREPGQLTAHLDGTKMSIRITDVGHNQRFIGRVYDDGNTFYYSGREVRNNKAVIYEPTIEESLKLIDYARGIPVERPDGQGFLGQRGTHTIPTRGGGTMEINNTYRSATMGSTYLKTGDIVDTNGERFTTDIMLRTDSTAIRDGYAALGEEYLREAINSARDEVYNEVDVEGLITEYVTHQVQYHLGEYYPSFHPDPQIGAIQQEYWRLLAGEKNILLRPGEAQDAYDKATGAYLTDDPLGGDIEPGSIDVEELREKFGYTGPVENQIRQHAEDLKDHFIGTYEPRETTNPKGETVIQRFDPVNVAKYMSTAHSSFRNSDDIVESIKLINENAETEEEKITTDQLIILDNFYARTLKDRFVTFDDTTAVDGSQHDNDFIRGMGTVVRETLANNGFSDIEIKIDDNGIIAWKGLRDNTLSRVGRDGTPREPVEVTGEIGQIFPRSNDNTVTTRFASGENYMFVPGYEAEIVQQNPGEDRTAEQRTRLRGYEDIMREAIQYQVAKDVRSSRTTVGTTTSVNNVYRRLYDQRFPTNWHEISEKTGLDEKTRNDILATESRRVTYGKEVREGSGLHREFWDNKRAADGFDNDSRNDNFYDVWLNTGARNMGVIDERSDGYFDKSVTGTARNQGNIRYLVENAKIRPDGYIETSPEVNDRAPIAKNDLVKNLDFDAADRQIMTFSNLHKASGVARDAKTGMFTFGGWTYEDGIVVSQQFANSVTVQDGDGFRGLKIGDKISDFHGNKGVIAAVIDPNMDEYEAEALGVAREVQIFKDNPTLDVVMSPFSGISRHNGGSGRDLLEGDTEHLDLTGVDNNQIEGGISTTNFIITPMTVDAKTNIYTDEDLADGKGRKLSAQPAWVLYEKECRGILNEAYGANSGAIRDYREYLSILGADIDPMGRVILTHEHIPGPDGTPQLVNNTDYFLGEKQHFRVDDIPLNATTKSGAQSINIREMRKQFRNIMEQNGGVLDLPFPLTLPSGENLLQQDDAGYPTLSGENPSYALPVLAPHLRSGQELHDGVSTMHDYTSHYRDIYECAIRYRHTQQQMETGVLDAVEGSKELKKQVAKAQRSYNKIIDDVNKRVLSGKHNYVKEHIMTRRLPNSATAVWSANPKLKMDEICISPEMAENLGVESGDRTLVWRDPVLSTGALRGFKVRIDPSYTGIGIHPSVVASMDGDFDGDTVGIWRPQTKAALKDLDEKLSPEANMLDLNSKDANGEYDLYFGDGLDYAVSMHTDDKNRGNMENPDSYRNRYAEIKTKVNEVHNDYVNGEISHEEWLEINRAYFDDLSTLNNEMLSTQYGDAAIRFDSIEAHVQSMREACVETGAKGSEGKLKEYCRYLGYDMDTNTDLGVTQHTREDEINSQKALQIKTEGTGIAGAYSQRGVRNLGSNDMEAVLGVTYGMTQGALQAKHDAIEALQRYDVMSTTARSLWKGQELEKTVLEDGTFVWDVVTDGGAPKQCSPEKWVNQFIDVYTSENGMNVPINRDYVERIADLLADEETGLIRNMEDTPELCPTLDRLAYPGQESGMKLVLEAAKNKESLFTANVVDGKVVPTRAGIFMPTALKTNIKAVMADTPARVGVDKNIVLGDTHYDTTGMNAFIARSVEKREPHSAPLRQLSSDYVQSDYNQELADKDARENYNAAYDAADKAALEDRGINTVPEFTGNYIPKDSQGTPPAPQQAQQQESSLTGFGTTTNNKADGGEKDTGMSII